MQTKILEDQVGQTDRGGETDRETRGGERDIDRERERERERERGGGGPETHPHPHSHRERHRERKAGGKRVGERRQVRNARRGVNERKDTTRKTACRIKAGEGCR